MSDLGSCIVCRLVSQDVVVGLCDPCAERFAPGEPRATVGCMDPHNPPTYAVPVDAARAAEEAIAALSALVAVDASLAPVAARAIGEIRSKYHEIGAGPTDPPEVKRNHPAA